MSRLTRDELESLFHHEDAPCVSLFLPTHRAGPETRQDPIRLKNLLRAAADRLESDGMTPEDAQTLLESGWARVEDNEVWQHQKDGLALFLARGFERAFRVAKTLPEMAVVGERFVVTPLLSLVPGDERFHVLALSQGRTRLFVGDRDTLDEADAEAIPESLRDVVGYDVEQRSLQFHTQTGGGPGAGGGQRTIYHGHGAGDEDDDELERFLRRVDRAVIDLLAVPHPPLVLAAVEHVAALYRKVSRHDRLADEIFEGNPDRSSAAELHAGTWPIAERALGAPRRSAIETYASLAHTDRASTDLGTVLAAGVNGRIGTLFVRDGAERWGRFDAASRSLSLEEETGRGENLIGRAAMVCLENSGTLYVLSEDDMPGGEEVAAIFRY